MSKNETYRYRMSIFPSRLSSHSRREKGKKKNTILNINSHCREICCSRYREKSNIVPELQILALSRYQEILNVVEEFEMAEIDNNDDLQKSLKRALSDAKNRNGKFVD